MTFSPPAWTGFNFVSTLHYQPTPSFDPSIQSLPSPFTVCITGASRGIGAETAKAFVQAGATGLILTAREEASLQNTREQCGKLARGSIKITTLGADIGAEEAAKELAKIVHAQHGRLDVLINNAGILSTHASAFAPLVTDIGTDQLQDVMQTNYVGKFLTIKYLLPLLLSSPQGAKAIINITSFSSHFATMPLGFSISELANNRLTEGVAELHKAQGIVAYAVHPGMVLTTPPPGLPQSYLETLRDSPGLCGAFLVWLVKERRDWLSGRYLAANWDVEELEALKKEIVRGDKLKFRMVI
ncbi:NAD(P)-binding protein [Lophiostoma macrostomum CBS 122681]|uniref:NAD(P)-binding protein n=1 Tax=Lophiostoma macrostomum CBS 122681 TaxID=1314788 RepID=A0A6A6STM4_9PLEO|nr:NAD(P)-binding protein [Lophiostoma macrostomum CBS 122681]